MRGSRGFHVDVLKTSASHRTIGLPAAAIERAARAAAANAATGDAGNGLVGDLVFPSRRGTVLEPSNVRRELARICAAAGVPKITPNELRHTCATMLNDDGVPLELIADMLGHTTTAMLQRHYRHRVRPSADAAVGTMDHLFDEPGQPASADSRARMNSASASADTSRREPSRNERNSPDRRNGRRWPRHTEPGRTSGTSYARGPASALTSSSWRLRSLTALPTSSEWPPRLPIFHSALHEGHRPRGGTQIAAEEVV